MLNKKLLTKTFRGTTAESERIACEALRTLTSNGVVLDDTLGIHSAGCADARVDALVIVANLVARTTRVFYIKKSNDFKYIPFKDDLPGKLTNAFRGTAVSVRIAFIAIMAGANSLDASYSTIGVSTAA